MMLGLARRIAQRCGPPVVCSLSGEDMFLEKIPPPWYDPIRSTLAERAADVDAFVALNRYYADFMSEYLPAPRARVHIIPHGLDLGGHAEIASQFADATPQIGYLARVCHEKGLHLLVDACEQLIQRGRLNDLRLHAAGYLGAGDRAYFQSIERRVADGPLRGRFTYHGELTRDEKIAFLQRLHVMSTPTVYRESKGLPILEAWANGTPVVAPDHGAFPEMIAAAGGGVLFRPGDAGHLADRLAEALADRAALAALGRAGHAAIRTEFTAEKMAVRTTELYRQLVEVD